MGTFVTDWKGSSGRRPHTEDWVQGHAFWEWGWRWKSPATVCKDVFSMELNTKEKPDDVLKQKLPSNALTKKCYFEWLTISWFPCEIFTGSSGWDFKQCKINSCRSYRDDEWSITSAGRRLSCRRGGRRRWEDSALSSSLRYGFIPSVDNRFTSKMFMLYVPIKKRSNVATIECLKKDQKEKVVKCCLSLTTWGSENHSRKPPWPNAWRLPHTRHSLGCA